MEERIAVEMDSIAEARRQIHPDLVVGHTEADKRAMVEMDVERWERLEPIRGWSVAVSTGALQIDEHRVEEEQGVGSPSVHDQTIREDC